MVAMDIPKDDPQRELFALLKSASVVVLTIGSGDDVSPATAMQLGVAVAYDKPIVAIVDQGIKVPTKLSKLVDVMIYRGDNPIKLAESIQSAVLALCKGKATEHG
ncbi:hypothetical protein VN12_16675 [Pirellula sp. SH-Sr6A]|uniref:hypothetical protein n=1 Tax=Pirellula sp. SH-Sr6A TaxID=1632865 RepID=UPI00078E6281|nr:hypothetical protein [Pirellula sp. SH-Sr6A]AMV33766.1 hypothetical protein VN12_16675 [Pirellula sp. SH-Sr6A]